MKDPWSPKESKTQLPRLDKWHYTRSVQQPNQ